MVEEVSRDKILFIGNETDQTLSILRQIVGANANATEVSFETHNFKTFPLHIDNKYYSAKLQVIHIHKNILELTEVREKLGEVCEALVIAVDATKKENLEVIRGWGSFVEEFSPSVNLCVAHTVGSSAHKEIEAWCMDNGVEFVLPSEGNKAEDQGPFQEKFGADRVIEALQANMWPNMEYKTEKRPTAAITEEDDEPIQPQQSEPKVEEQSQEKPKEKLTKAQRREKAIQREKEEQSLREAEAKHKQLQEQRARIEKKKSKGKKLTAEDLLRLSVVEDKDEELEEKMEDDLKNFERALQDMSLLRSKAQSMPDDQRREFAAKMAMQLLSGFGLDDEGSDSD